MSDFFTIIEELTVTNQAKELSKNLISLAKKKIGMRTVNHKNRGAVSPCFCNMQIFNNLGA